MLLRKYGVAVLGACLAVLMGAGCSGDKIQKARRLVDTEPEKALELLGQAVNEKGESFDSLIYTGLTYEKLGRDAEAVAVYEKALTMPDAVSRPEPVPERLLALYEKRHGLVSDRNEKLALARRAAALEKTLKVARPWASTFLLDVISSDMAAAGVAGDEQAVRKLIDEGMELAVPTELKNSFGEKATAAMRQAFVVRAGVKFMESAAQELGRRGIFVSDDSRIVFSNDFVIPSEKSGPEFDPANPAFLANVRKGACVPLYAQLSETVSYLEPILGLTGIDETGLNVAFETLYKNGAKAGFKAYGGASRKPNGQTWLCEINVPLADFLASIFVFAE